MKLKLDADGRVVVQDGKPVYVHDDGKEVAFDAAGAVGTISRITDESKKYKERAQTAESAIKSFEGIEDAEAARKALETVKNLKDGELVTAGKVEEIKAAAAKAAKEQVESAARASAERIKELEAKSGQLEGELYGEKVGGHFSRSKFVTEKLTLPSALAQKSFGDHFKVEDGKVVGYDATGNKIYSRSKPGELADFDEALETLVDASPFRDDIRRGTGNSGSGARDTNGGSGGNGRQMTRREFEGLDAAGKAKAMTVDKVALVD